MYRNIGSGMFEKLEVTDIIDLQKLRDDLQRLEHSQGPEPTQQELIDAGRAVHPYYDEQGHIDQRITYLQDLISVLEGMEK